MNLETVETLLRTSPFLAISIYLFLENKKLFKKIQKQGIELTELSLANKQLSFSFDKLKESFDKLTKTKEDLSRTNEKLEEDNKLLKYRVKE